MPGGQSPDPNLEIAHVLFIDIVGYSKLLVDDQRELQQQLNQIVRDTEQFRSADAAGKLVALPTGDGMALVFFTSPEAPVQCALEISETLLSNPQLKVRMGINSGPVSGLADVNDRSNVAGAGINMAQRVMDCGDAGHILLSRHVAEDLEQYAHWKPHLHDLGECEVKHGRKVSLFNFYSESFGNATTPQKIKCISKSTKTPRLVFGGKAIFFGALGLAGCLAFGYYLFNREIAPKRSIAVLPFVDLSPAKELRHFVL